MNSKQTNYKEHQTLSYNKLSPKY